MDYPFEYVERIWKYPNFTQAEIEKLKQKDDKSAAKSKSGDCGDSEDDAEWEEEDVVDRKEKRILKELEELEKECEKFPKKDGDTESSTDSSCLTGGFNSFLETTDSDDVDRLFTKIEENEDVAARRFKIMRQCICHSPECSSRSVSSEDSSSSICTSTGDDSDDDPTTEDEIPGLEKGKEASMSEEELEDLYERIDEETSSGSEEEEPGADEKETESSEGLSTSSEETDSESDAGFDVEQELEVMEEMLEAKLREEEEKRNPRQKKEDWETDSDEDTDSEEDSEEERKEDGSEGSGGEDSDGKEETSKMESSKEPGSNKELEPKSREIKTDKKKRSDKGDNVEEKSKEPKTAKAKKSDKEEAARIQKAVGEPSGEERSMKRADESEHSSRSSSSSDKVSLSSSLSPTSSSSPSGSFHSSDSSSTTSGSMSSVSSSTTPTLSPSSSSTSSSTLLATISISSDSLILSESASEDDDSAGIRHFDWDSDDVYASTGTDEDLEKVLEFLDNAMKIVDGVFTEKEVEAVEKLPPIEMEKFKNFALPLPEFLETTTKYEMLEEVEDPKDIETLHKNFWMLQQLDTGHMNSAKIVSRKNPLPEHKQLRKDLENERRLLHELLPELPDPTHIARIEDMGFNEDIKFLIYEDFGTDLLTLFETNHEVLHKSSSLFLITYFTFNAIKELHNYDLVHTNIRPSAYSIQLSPFNVKLIDYSKVRRFGPSPWKTTEKMKPDAFSPRVFHQKDMEFDEFVDFESWIYTMLFLCTKQGLPWMNDNENMLKGKEEFYDDTCDLDYTGCTEAVPIAAGLLANETMSYEEFMDRMTYVFSIDSMMFSETDRPILYHPEELEEDAEKKMEEDPFGALDENHWDPADESDSSDGIGSAEEREMYGEMWKEMGLDQDGNEMVEVEGDQEDPGDEGKGGKVLEIQGKERVERRPEGRAERSEGPQSETEKSAPEKSGTGRKDQKKDREEQKTQKPSPMSSPASSVKEKPERSMEKSSDKMSEKSEQSRNEEEKSGEKKAVSKEKPANGFDEEFSDTELTLGELMDISESELEVSDESTFSTSSSSESSADSFSSWTSSTDLSDNPKFQKWNEKIKKKRVEKAEYAELENGEKSDFETYDDLVAEWIKENNYSSSDDGGPGWSSDSESEKSPDSEKDESSEKDKKEREKKKKEVGKEAKSKGSKSKEPMSKGRKK